jgi:hypothetical protein
MVLLMGNLIKIPSMKNELDLRKKTEPRMVERIVFQRRPWHVEALKLALAILVATGAVYAISKADEISSLVSHENPTKSFSAIGFVSGVADGRVSIEKAKGSDGRTDASYSFGLATVSKIETSEYVAIPASLLRVGDQVIVQGTETEGVVTPTRIVSFAQISAEDIAAAQAAALIIAETVATSTPIVSTSTPNVSTSTPVAVVVASTTPSEGMTTDADVVFASTTSGSIVAETASTSTEAVATSTDSSVTSNDPVAPAIPEVIAPVAAPDAQIVEPSAEPAPIPVE